MNIDDIRFNRNTGDHLANADKTRTNTKRQDDASAAGMSADNIPKKQMTSSSQNSNQSNQVDSYHSTRQSGQMQDTTTNQPQAGDTPVRPAKIEAAKRFVATGAYEKADVVNTIIDRLITVIREG